MGCRRRCNQLLHLSKCSSSLNTFPSYIRKPSQTASPPCTTESNTETFTRKIIRERMQRFYYVLIMVACHKVPVTYTDIPLHCYGAKVHLQPKQECFYLQGQAEEGPIMVVAAVLLSSLFGASACCRKASFAQAGHKTRMGKSTIKQEIPW